MRLQSDGVERAQSCEQPVVPPFTLRGQRETRLLSVGEVLDAYSDTLSYWRRDQVGLMLAYHVSEQRKQSCVARLGAYCPYLARDEPWLVLLPGRSVVTRVKPVEVFWSATLDGVVSYYRTTWAFEVSGYTGIMLNYPIDLSKRVPSITVHWSSEASLPRHPMDLVSSLDGPNQDYPVLVPTDLFGLRPVFGHLDYYWYFNASDRDKARSVFFFRERKRRSSGSVGAVIRDRARVISALKGTNFRDHARVISSLKGTKSLSDQGLDGLARYRSSMASLSRAIFDRLTLDEKTLLARQAGYLPTRTGEGTDGRATVSSGRRAPRFKRLVEMTPLPLNSAVVGDSRSVARPNSVKLMEVKPVGEKQSHLRPPKVVVTAPPYVERISGALEVLSASLGTLTAQVSTLVQSIGWHLAKLTADMERLVTQVSTQTDHVRHFTPPPVDDQLRPDQYSSPVDNDYTSQVHSLVSTTTSNLKTDDIDSNSCYLPADVQLLEIAGEVDHHEMSVIPPVGIKPISSAVPDSTLMRAELEVRYTAVARMFVRYCVVGTTPRISVVVVQRDPLLKAIVPFTGQLFVFFYGTFIGVRSVIVVLPSSFWSALNFHSAPYKPDLGLGPVLNRHYLFKLIYVWSRPLESHLMAEYLGVKIQYPNLSFFGWLASTECSPFLATYLANTGKINRETFLHVENSRVGYDLDFEGSVCLPSPTRVCWFFTKATFYPISRHCCFASTDFSQIRWYQKASTVEVDHEGAICCAFHRNWRFLCHGKTYLDTMTELTSSLTPSEQVTCFFRNLPGARVPFKEGWVQKYQLLGALSEYVDEVSIQHMLAVCFNADCPMCDRTLSLYISRSGILGPDPLRLMTPKVETKVIKPVLVPVSKVFSRLSRQRVLRVGLSVKLLYGLSLGEAISEVYAATRPDKRFCVFRDMTIVVQLGDIPDRLFYLIEIARLKLFSDATEKRTDKKWHDDREELARRGEQRAIAAQVPQEVKMHLAGLSLFGEELLGTKLTKDWCCMVCGVYVLNCRCEHWWQYSDDEDVY